MVLTVATCYKHVATPFEVKNFFHTKSQRLGLLWPSLHWAPAPPTLTRSFSCFNSLSVLRRVGLCNNAPLHLGLPIWCKTSVWRCRNAVQLLAAADAVWWQCILRLPRTGSSWRSPAASSPVQMALTSCPWRAVLPLSATKRDHLSVKLILPLKLSKFWSFPCNMRT